MSNKVTIKISEQRKLHVKSGNRCAKCQEILVTENVCVGENAHIYGEKPDAARYDATLDTAFVNSEKNLIFLCNKCHKIVDTNVAEYPPELLFKMKKEHEEEVFKALEKEAPNVSSAELQVLIKCLIDKSGEPIKQSSFEILKIQDKINKNCLSEVQGYITLGLASVNKIEDYLNKNPDPKFANRLRNAMVAKYNELKSLSDNTIDIFNQMWVFSSCDKDEYNYKSAGLGILIYFFEKCEVFEK
jgi:hypothetical protein